MAGGCGAPQMMAGFSASQSQQGGGGQSHLPIYSDNNMQHLPSPPLGEQLPMSSVPPPLGLSGGGDSTAAAAAAAAASAHQLPRQAGGVPFMNPHALEFRPSPPAAVGDPAAKVAQARVQNLVIGEEDRGGSEEGAGTAAEPGTKLHLKNRPLAVATKAGVSTKATKAGPGEQGDEQSSRGIPREAHLVSFLE